jgi:hypothetical protein
MPDVALGHELEVAAEPGMPGEPELAGARRAG